MFMYAMYVFLSHYKDNDFFRHDQIISQLFSKKSSLKKKYVKVIIMLGDMKKNAYLCSIKKNGIFDFNVKEKKLKKVC